jgi:hypothetical protein
VEVGFATGAAPAFGAKDRPRPPAIASPVRLHVAPAEGPALARSLKPSTTASDAPTAEGAAWDLTLRLGSEAPSDGRTYLQVAADGQPPKDFRRYVVDLDRDERLPVTHQTARVPVADGTEARHLRVIVGTEAFAEEHSGGASLAIGETTLRANAPNPFRRSTTIPYQVAEQTEVEIAVYDVLGRRVATLVDGRRDAGLHHLTWRPGESGAALASGVYFCRLTAGDHTSTEKLVVVR